MIALLLLVFGLTRASGFPFSVDIPVHPDYDVTKVVGMWHPIGIASRMPELTEYEKKISPVDHTVAVWGRGNLLLTAFYMDNGICKESVFMLKSTEKPGVFKIPYGKVITMDTDYDNYIIFYVKKPTHDAILLSARSSEVGDDIKKLFRKFVLAQNIPEDHITYFENVEQCTP